MRGYARLALTPYAIPTATAFGHGSLFVFLGFGQLGRRFR